MVARALQIPQVTGTAAGILQNIAKDIWVIEHEKNHIGIYLAVLFLQVLKMLPLLSTTRGRDGGGAESSVALHCCESHSLQEQEA